MISILHKLTAPFSQKHQKEPPKKLLHQGHSKWSHGRKKIALSALTTFSTIGAASYLVYRNSFSKINLSDSASTSINTAFKVIGSLSALAGIGLWTYFSNAPKQTHSKEKNGLISLKSLNDNKQKPKEVDITKILSAIKEEKINKDLLNKQIETYVENSTNSPQITISKEKFISAIYKLIQKYQGFLSYNWIDKMNKKSSLHKIIDILDAFIDRTDPLSLELIDHLFPDIIPNGLYELTKEFISLDDFESKELVNRSYQLVFKTLSQQMKILFSDGSDLKTITAAKKAFIRILNLLTVFEKDNSCQRSSFYMKFIQHSPENTWRFIHFIFEYLINNKLSVELDLLPDKIIAHFLNSSRNDENEKEVSPHTDKDGLNILKKIVNCAQLSLFLDGQNQEAASFAIRLIQYKLKMDPEKNDFNLKDGEILKQLYVDLSKTKDLDPFYDFGKKNDLSDQATEIATELRNECSTAFFIQHLLNSEEAKVHEKFINIVAPFPKIKEYSKQEIVQIQILSHFIKSQLHNFCIPLMAELASLALNEYTQVFLNKESVNIIRDGYTKNQPIENMDLDSACKKFFKTWDELQEHNAKVITEINNLELVDNSKEEEEEEEELPADQKIIENSK